MLIFVEYDRDRVLVTRLDVVLTKLSFEVGIPGSANLQIRPKVKFV